MRKRLLSMTGAGAVLVAVLLSFWGPADTVAVAASDDLQTELDRAPEGSLVLLQAGVHSGGVTVDKRMVIRGLPGATIVAPPDTPAVLTVSTDRAVIQDLELVGGSTGLIIREAQGVVARNVAVRASDLHGIEVIDAAAHISGSRIEHLQHEMSQGIEIRNSDGRPDSVVEESVVRGGQEGIVSHVSEVVVRNNYVEKTTMRAITITEMSDGVVQGNTISDARGAGLYCGDMSRCEFSGNQAAAVRAGAAGGSRAGWGLVVTHHAVASSDRDRLSGDAGGTYTSIGGHLSDGSPLDPSGGWIPVVAATVTAILCLWLLYHLSTWMTRTFDPSDRQLRVRAASGVLSLIAGGLAVQTFHMIEHGLQVFRVHIDQVPSRGGLVGPAVEAEWIHFIYNTTVLVGIACMALARVKGWSPPGRRDVADRLLLVGLLAQGYHVVEHTAKLVQHLVGGAKVNPGFAGQLVDLVLLHYALNLLVYLAMVGAAVAYTYPLLAHGVRHLLARARPNVVETTVQGTP